MTVHDARKTLPKVGDIRMETMTDPHHPQMPQECIVIEVHPDHLWYRVRFTGSGCIECYKLPQTERLSWEG